MLPEPQAVGRDSGVSMVEILVAMLLFSVLMIGLIPVFVQSMTVANRAASITSSSRIANGAVETARAFRTSGEDKTLWCHQFTDFVGDTTAFPTVASDGGRTVQVAYGATCTPGDRSASLQVTVKQGTKMLTDVKTQVWLFNG